MRNATGDSETSLLMIKSSEVEWSASISSWVEPGFTASPILAAMQMNGESTQCCAGHWLVTNPQVTSQWLAIAGNDRSHDWCQAVSHSHAKIMVIWCKITRTRFHTIASVLVITYSCLVLEPKNLLCSIINVQIIHFILLWLPHAPGITSIYPLARMCLIVISPPPMSLNMMLHLWTRWEK